MSGTTRHLLEPARPLASLRACRHAILAILLLHTCVPRCCPCDSCRYRFQFQIPSYYTLLVRSLSVLEGIALASDPNYKVGLWGPALGPVSGALCPA